MRTVALIGMLVLVAVAVIVGCTTMGKEEQGGYPYNTKYCVQCQTYHPLNHAHFQKAPEAAKPAVAPKTEPALKPATAPKTGETTPKTGTATQ